VEDYNEQMLQLPTFLTCVLSPALASLFSTMWQVDMLHSLLLLLFMLRHAYSFFLI
jgi:hypothetical protein